MRAGGALGRTGERGKGLIGFLFAVALVVLLAYSLSAIYRVRRRADIMDTFTYEVIQKADRMKWKVEDVRAEIYKKARELGVGIEKSDRIEVIEAPSGWKVNFEFDDVAYLPGFAWRTHTKVERSWTRF